MRNNQINQNVHYPQQSQLSEEQVIIKPNGKISLSKSTQSHPENHHKDKQINSLKKEIFKLKCQLQQQKTQNKKMTILSNEIKKVKEKLIEKVKQKHLKDQEQKLLGKKLQHQTSNNLASQRHNKQIFIVNGQNQSTETPKVERLKDSTYHIFKNFSILNSVSKKSQNNQQKHVKKSSQTPKKLNLDDISSLESRQFKQSIINERRLKFKSKQQAFFEDKTVKRNSFRQKVKQKNSFFNEFEKYDTDIDLIKGKQKFSVKNCIRTKKQLQNNKALQQAESCMSRESNLSGV